MPRRVERNLVQVVNHDVRGHGFGKAADQARRALDLGFHLSFAGTVTFPKALDIQEAAKQAPLDKLLVETDAPYLTPAPRRGKRNEPAFVVETAKKRTSQKASRKKTAKKVHAYSPNSSLPFKKGKSGKKVLKKGCSRRTTGAYKGKVVCKRKMSRRKAA